MLADAVDLLRCVRCGLPVAVTDQVLACRGRHRHDIARQGYVNLLSSPAPVNADSAAMVTARETYLAAGAHDAVREVLVAQAGRRVLDAGCGPGWYFAALPSPTQVVGLDLSVAAARRAARAHPRAAVLVSDLRDPWPVADSCIDTVWCVFAPRHLAECRRVLAPDGQVIVVIPTPDHLIELRDAGAVLGLHPEKETRLVEQFDAARWRPVWRHRVHHRVEISARHLAAITAMGPSAHHRMAAAPDRVSPVTISVLALGFRPTH